jgi:hypothetical protein
MNRPQRINQDINHEERSPEELLLEIRNMISPKRNDTLPKHMNGEEI